MNVALAAAATLVSTAFALSTLDRWLRRRRPHELAWTDLAGAVRARVRRAVVGRGARVEPGQLPRVLPGGRDAERAVAGARHRLPAGRRAHRPTARNGCSSWLSWLSVGHRAVRAHARNRSAAPTCRRARTCSAWRRVCSPPSGPGVAALVIIAGALWSAWRLRAPARPRDRRRHDSGGRLARSTGARQPADRGRHAGAVGQRHAWPGDWARTGRSSITLLVGHRRAVRRLPGVTQQASGSRASPTHAATCRVVTPARGGGACR